MKINTQILRKGALYLSALSGGADSTALLLQLAACGYRVEAVHCNFHLRGEESDRDENFCRRLCDAHGIPLHVAHFDTMAYAAARHESIETAARNLRYDYFFRLAADIGARGVCVAHNMNDQAETLMMNIVRGAGLHGLTGMKAVSIHHASKVMGDGGQGTIDVELLRPMLGVSRSEIEEYLRGMGQEWVTDSTNLETDATRNKFRLQILPMLERINPSATGNIARAASRLAEAERMYAAAVGSSVEAVTSSDGRKIDLDALKRQPSPEAVLYEIASRYGFNGKQVADIVSNLSATSGTTWSSATHDLVIDRGTIIIADRNGDGDFSMVIPEEGNYLIGREHHLRVKTLAWDSQSKVSREPNAVCLDASGVSFPLTLRIWKEGDRFVPFGMTGSKLVSDFLTDRKVALVDKRRQLVLCDAGGNVLWVVGMRPDNRFRIRKTTTKCLLCSYE